MICNFKKNIIFENNIYLQNEKKCTMHSNLDGYVHLFWIYGIYIKELAVIVTDDTTTNNQQYRTIIYDN